MDSRQLNCGAVIYSAKIISATNGKVLHALKRTDPGFIDFGEAYFSTVEQFTVKGWKKHRHMVMNLTVPIGSIRFHLTKDLDSDSIESVVMGADNYHRLYVPSGIWLAFEGLSSGTNLLMNLASIEHDPLESTVKEFSR